MVTWNCEFKMSVKVTDGKNDGLILNAVLRNNSNADAEVKAKSTMYWSPV